MAAASIGLLFAAPIIGMAAILVHFEGGSPFFCQQRLGRQGRPFVIYKLRTMHLNSEAQLKILVHENLSARTEFLDSGGLKVDPRITSLGKILRRYGIDELPQLLNVIKGDMSLVGPRPRTMRWLSPTPDRPDASTAYYQVRPGITGLWQVSEYYWSGDQARMRLDEIYVASISFRNDISIILKTCRLMILGRRR